MRCFPPWKKYILTLPVKRYGKALLFSFFYFFGVLFVEQIGRRRLDRARLRTDTLVSEGGLLDVRKRGRWVCYCVTGYRDGNRALVYMYIQEINGWWMTSRTFLGVQGWYFPLLFFLTSIFLGSRTVRQCFLIPHAVFLLLVVIFEQTPLVTYFSSQLPSLLFFLVDSSKLPRAEQQQRYFKTL